MIKTLGIISTLIASLLVLGGFSSSSMVRASYASLDNTAEKNEEGNSKIVILTFGNAPESQYIYAKPVLDKYGFKGSFFIVCNWIQTEEGYKMKEPRMTWEQIEAS
jgi:peptidoglycan/xylan/chitin deacetylase (PgdA/CDA1 family)